MKPITNTPLFLAFVIVLAVFLLFCGGAITMSMFYADMNKSSFLSNISWMWMPTLVSFFLSILLGWALFWKKD